MNKIYRLDQIIIGFYVYHIAKAIKKLISGGKVSKNG